MSAPRGPDDPGAAARGHRRRLRLALSALAGAALAALAAASATPPPQAPTPAPTASIVDPFAGASALQAERLRGLRPEIARAILRDAPGGEIALAALAIPLPSTGGGSRVALFVEIDGASFLAANQADMAPVEIYAYALTAAGGVAGYLAEAVNLDVARHGEAVWNGGLRYVGWLQLAPGTYELRVMVSNARSLARGLESVRLEVPAADQRPAVLPPIFAGRRVRDPWLGVRGRAGWQPAGVPAYPLTAGGRALLPSARPVLVVGRAATARLFAGKLPPTPIRGSVELLGEAPAGDTADAASAGRPIVASASFDAEARVQDVDGETSIEVRFLPPAAPPGRYALRLRLDSASGAIATPAIDVLLIDLGPRDRELLWSDLKGFEGGLEREPDEGPEPPPVATADSGLPPTGEAQDRARAGRGERRLPERYRQALASSARGGERRPAALLDFELGALGDGDEEPLARLRQAEIQVAADLGRRRADLLLPVIGMHDDLFHLYRRRQLFSLVAHTRELIELLAELYAELGGAPETAADAARQHCRPPAGDARLRRQPAALRAGARARPTQPARAPGARR